MPGDLRPGYFMTARAWLDDDGEHVHLAHDCLTERVRGMQPWPTWRANGAMVEPSVSCTACGLHTHVPLTDPPEPWDADHAG